MFIGNHLIDSPYILAPLAGYTDLPFRLLARRLGCGLAYTEMISAEGLFRQKSLTLELLESDPADHPLTVQLFGGRPEALARAAAFLEDWGADIIDLNLGCPVKKVVKTGSGSALLKDPSRAQAIFKAVRRATTLPLTVKLRAGWRPGRADRFDGSPNGRGLRFCRRGPAPPLGGARFHRTSRLDPGG